MFAAINLSDWKQFASVGIEFHHRLTVLTGANGAGKTTILNILNSHFGWGPRFTATPEFGSDGKIFYTSDVRFDQSGANNNGQPPKRKIGRILYEGGHDAGLVVPVIVDSQYRIQIMRYRKVPGVFFHSHRPVAQYSVVESIPTQVGTSEEILNQYLRATREFYGEGSRPKSTSFRLKEALISLATFGYGNAVVARNEEAVSVFEGFVEILRTVLPIALGFQKIEIRRHEVLLVTDTGDFSFDAVSGGVAAIIDMAWQIYMAARVFSKFVVVIDEPENHLHPTLQKSLLPSFMRAFPKAQFIIATHNPFMVTSVPDSSVYVLSYNNDNPSRVYSRKLDLINKASSSSEILREVLGLDHTRPEWVERRIDRIVQRYAEQEIDDRVLREIKSELNELGVGDFFPETLSKIRSR